MSTYEISKSSLLSLKAEILRKQEEVNKTKLVNETKKAQANKNIQLEFKNKGIEERKLRDLSEEDENLLNKSRTALEFKARLYDKLSNRSHFSEEELESSNRFLVRFDRKSRQKHQIPSDLDDERYADRYPDSEEEKLCNDYEPAKNPDEEWVDYTDCLGRTRSCMRKDLEFLKTKDAEFRASVDKDENKAEQLRKPDEKKVSEESKNPDEFDETNELLSSDMRREFLRQQWEKEESELRKKDKLHYQDILFNEARTHGVGYYAFSKDEEERAKQQDALKNLRQETKQEQEKAQELKNLREKQLAARAKAARNRKRARMGLPPEEDELEVEKPVEESQPNEEEQKKAAEEEKKEQEKNAARKKHIRPWDIGKEGIREHYEHSQEEWVDKKRKERPKEFAPPKTYQRNFRSESKSKKEDDDSEKLLYFSTKKDRHSSEKSKDECINPYKTKETFDYESNHTITQESIPIVNECVDFDDEQDRLLNDYNSAYANDNDFKENPTEISERGRGIEIAPPPTFEYYGPNTSKKIKYNQGKENLLDSISEGLKFLRQQAEKKKAPSKRASDLFLF